MSRDRGPAVAADAAAAHNEVLTQLFDAFLPRLRLAMIDTHKIHPALSASVDHAAHRQLAAAIAARKPTAASQSSRTHLTALKDAFS